MALRTAILGIVLAALSVFPACAVYLNPAGVGQALIYPYYTVRSAGGNAYNTYVSVGNNSQTIAIVAKVRFREGRNSRVVAEFNLYLAPGDMWTAALVPDGEGTRLVTADRSCTNPAIPAGGLSFSNAAFSGGDDRAGTGLERTKEGHFEIIEMGSTIPIPEIVQRSGQFDCSAVQGNGLRVDLILAPPINLLSGAATLINVENGSDATYAADALAALTSTAFYTRPGVAGSDFDSPAVDPVSHATVDNVSYRLVWNRGVDAVDAALAARLFENEFILDPGTDSRTDWVLTLPTKRFFVTTTAAQRPFVAPFGFWMDQLHCEGVRVESYTREGESHNVGGFPEPPASPHRLCWSAGAFSVRASTQAIPVGQSDVLGAANTLGWNASFLPSGQSPPPGGVSLPVHFVNGHSRILVTAAFRQSLPTSTWMDLRTGETGSGPVSVAGYAAAGFMIRTLTNAMLPCGAMACQRNFASAQPHRRIHLYSRP
jgi:hypothetical protein